MAVLWKVDLNGTDCSQFSRDMHSKYGRHHMYQYFHGPKRPCGGEAKLMKLCLYTVLVQYYLCTKEQLLTDTTTYLNF